MTLLENLLMSRMSMASGGDSCTAISRAPAGTTPSRTLPVHVPPCRSHNARNTAAK